MTSYTESVQRNQIMMILWRWISYCQPDREDGIHGGRWNTGNSWNNKAVQRLETTGDESGWHLSRKCISLCY